MEKWLIVDDDPEDQDIFEMALNMVNPTIGLLKADNGIDAIALLSSLKEKLPHLIFLDLNMSRMNGRECIAELKTSEIYRDIPVFIYSTTSSTRDIDDLLAMGAERFITKPNDIQDLIDLLKEIILVRENR